MQIKLKPWLTPNFVIPEMPPIARQDGWKDWPGIPLADIDADSLAEQCDKFRTEIFAKAGKVDPAKENS